MVHNQQSNLEFNQKHEITEVQMLKVTGLHWTLELQQRLNIFLMSFFYHYWLRLTSSPVRTLRFSVIVSHFLTVKHFHA